MKLSRIKRAAVFAVTGIMIGSMLGCGKQNQNEAGGEQKPAVQNTDIEYTDTQTQQPETSTEQISQNSETAATGNSEDRDAMLKAYALVLNQIYQNHTFPDDNDYGWDDSFDMSDNKFAIYDIDRDGRDELMICYTTTYMGGMAELVYDYDSEADQVKQEFVQFPANTYYDNGVVVSEWSHNQGMAGEFWPYTLYQYDAATDTYQKVADVDAWDKTMGDTDYDGNAFPQETDADGDGIIYYVTKDGEDETKTPVDFEEYNEWYQSYIGSADKIEIPYLDFTEENIKIAD